VNALPATFAVGGGGTYCGPNGTGLPVELTGSQPNTTYTLYKDGNATTSVAAGTGNAITFGSQLAAGVYTVQASNTSNCISGMTGNASIAIDPQAPEKPADPAGPSVIITSSTPTSEYVSQSTYASAYSWELSPVQAGTITGDDAISLITWNQSYIGNSTIRVKGVNTCGSSTYSNEVNTTVNIGVGIPDNQTEAYRLVPNPAKYSVNISAPKEMVCDISVVNNTGKILLSKPGFQLSKENNLDISALPAGMYTVVLRNQSVSIALKLIVEK